MATLHIHTSSRAKKPEKKDWRKELAFWKAAELASFECHVSKSGQLKYHVVIASGNERRTSGFHIGHPFPWSSTKWWQDIATEIARIQAHLGATLLTDPEHDRKRRMAKEMRLKDQLRKYVKRFVQNYPADLGLDELLGIFGPEEIERLWKEHLVKRTMEK